MFNVRLIKSDIIFAQEHWLLPNNVNLLTNFKANYAGFIVLGCCDIEQFVQYRGRPYGGVRILWKQNTGFKCSVLGHDDLHRCLAVKLECQNVVIVCVNVYFPSFNNSVYNEEDILNCFAFIDSIFSQNLGSNVKFMVIGDFNFD